jgi:hypothetical protein
MEVASAREPAEKFFRDRAALIAKEKQQRSG